MTAGRDLQRIGCGRSSSDLCPIARRRGERKPITWGKSSTRKNTVGKKVKISCGEWCRICMNVIRARFSTRVSKYMKNDQKAKKGKNTNILR
eukprot:1945868-Lingulodinium_polyedra.AAC.1